MFAARAVHLANHVEPNLQAGRWVLCDRFTDATYAYQGGGPRPEHGSTSASWKRMVQGTRRPDLTLLLDAPVRAGIAARARQRNCRRRRRIASKANARNSSSACARPICARAAAEPERIAVDRCAASRPTRSPREFSNVLEARSWIS